MSTPVHAERLVVTHHDDRQTVYEDVRYWPWGGGTALTVFREDGSEVEHVDVYNTEVSQR